MELRRIALTVLLATVVSHGCENSMASTSLRIPRGILLPDLHRILVATRDGRFILLNAATGAPLAETNLAAEPLVAVGELVVAARAPQARDLGEVTLLRITDDRIVVVWSVPLLDHALHAPLAVDLDRVELNAKLDGDEIVVYADVHTRYGGGAMPDERRLAEAAGDHRLLVRLRRSDGEVVARIPVPEMKQPSDTSIPGRTLRPSRAPNRWELAAGEFDEAAVEVDLDEGTDAATVVGDEVIYHVTEVDPKSNTQRSYLRSATLATGQLRWSRLLEESTAKPRPPPPP